MPRNMSFAMTTAQIEARTKTITRRFGWWFLKPGDQICAVKKAMGLRKGETVERLALIEVVAVRAEPLELITQADVIAEGFPDWTPAQFVQMLVDHYRIPPREICNVIAFRYLDRPGVV